MAEDSKKSGFSLTKLVKGILSNKFGAAAAAGTGVFALGTLFTSAAGFLKKPLVLAATVAATFAGFKLVGNEPGENTPDQVAQADAAPVVADHTAPRM